jgi:pimeloyl-ACP methyl ester carboxylesterase
MNNITSKDGTQIAYKVTGRGPALILVPGALALASNFTSLAQELAEHFTVYTIERRGRGESGPQGNDYSIEKEIEDLQALQTKTGAKYVFGHSFGGFLLLEAARNNTIFDKIAVYDPGVSIDGSINMGWILRCQKELEQKKYHDAFTTFVQGLDPKSAKLPHWILAQILRIVMKKSEREQKYPLLAGTIREHNEEAKLDNTFEHYSEIPARVLLMFSDWPAAATAMTNLASVIPDFQTVTFSDLNHLGPEEKPVQIAQNLIKFYE